MGELVLLACLTAVRKHLESQKLQAGKFTRQIERKGTEANCQMFRTGFEKQQQNKKETLLMLTKITFQL